MSTKPHVLILGAGPAGCIAAATLLPQYNITIIDPCPAQLNRFKIGESLPAAAQRILKELDLWTGFCAQNHLPSEKKQSRWGSDELQIQDSFLNPEGNDFLINRSAFEYDLIRQIKARGAQKLSNKVLHYEKTPSHWGIQLNNQQTIHADWIIDATGRRASFARKAGAKRIHHDNLVAHWRLGSSSGVELGSYIESAENGWWYTASLPTKKRILAFFCETNTSPTDFTMSKHINQLLTRDSFTPETPIRKTAAHSMSLDHCQGDQWHSIGDATIGFDPLSSQGMFHALYTGLRSKQVLEGNSLHYQKEIHEIFASYQKHAQIYYRAEQRWPNNSFWKNRHLLKESQNQLQQQ